MTGIRPSLISASRRRVAVNLKDSLLHWWDLDASVATLNDQHGSLNLTRSGTLNTESTLAPDGGSCVSNPASGYFLASNVPSMTGFSTGFSVNIWVRRTSNSSTGNFFVTHRVSNTAGRYFQLIRLTSESKNQGYAYDSTAFQIVEAADVSLNTWHMLTLIVTASEISLYQNGVFSESVARTVGTDVANAPFAFFTGGFAVTNANIRHIGQLFACGIWSRALTQNDITNLYNSGAGRRYSSL
jgi:hypothetical protein